MNAYLNSEQKNKIETIPVVLTDNNARIRFGAAMEHGGEPVYALALSKSTSGLRVSVGHNDNAVKLWK
ncbi:hypothetical protein Tco_1464378 [Tanacetum coccineum]